MIGIKDDMLALDFDATVAVRAQKLIKEGGERPKEDYEFNRNKIKMMHQSVANLPRR